MSTTAIQNQVSTSDLVYRYNDSFYDVLPGMMTPNHVPSLDEEWLQVMIDYG